MEDVAKEWGEAEDSGSNYGYKLYWDEITLKKKADRTLIIEKLEIMAAAKQNNIEWELKEIANIQSDIKFLIKK
jgi:hypothetical protein